MTQYLFNGDTQTGDLKGMLSNVKASLREHLRSLIL